MEAQTQETPATEAPATIETQAAPAVDAPTDQAPTRLEEAEADHAAEIKANIEALAAAQVDDKIINSAEEYKGIDYNKVLSELPEDAKKMVSNLRSSYTKKTQGLSEERKALEIATAELDAQRKSLMNSDFYKDNAKLAEADKVQVDPFSANSLEKRIEQEVALRMQDMLKPLKNAHEQQQRQHKLAIFKKEHPDLMSMKKEVANTLKQNEHLTLEQAYWQVKGREMSKKASEQASELKQYKTAAKAAGLKVGGASRGKANGIPQYVLDQDDPVAIYNWIKSNKK